MRTKTSKPRPAELETGEWLTTMSQRLVSIDRHNELEAWLEADAGHARAYEAGKEVFQVAGSCSDLLAEARVEETAHSALRRRRLTYASVAASAVLALSAVLFAAGEFGAPSLEHRFETATAQVKDIELEDGTQVTLGAASQIAVKFGQHDRRVKLTRGEAFFEVTRDTSRPFVVMAGDTVVRVLGTKFDVHYGAREVRVGVVEGRVEVMHAVESRVAAQREPARKLLVTAGEAAVAKKAGAIVTSSRTNPEDLGAWRQGRLVYVDARLEDVVSDMNRYFDGEIRLASAGLGERQLTIAFRADEIGQGIALIEGALPARAALMEPGKVMLTDR